MKKLLTIVALLTGFAANAQEIKYGATSRLGAFTTLYKNEGAEHGLGLQGALGLWAKLPVTAKGAVQVNLLQTFERQHAGTITVIDESRSPIADAKVTDRNLAIVLQAIYLHALSPTFNIGIGTGAKYEYLSNAKVKAEYSNWNYVTKGEDTFNNTFRRDLTLHVPIELQHHINDRFTFVSQLQLQLSNRLGASETNFAEHDLGFTLGLNYSL